MKRDATPPTPAVLRARAEAHALETASAFEADLATRTPHETLGLLHELRVHQIELEMQNEELRRAHAELDGARLRYFDVYDQAPLGYCTLDVDGTVLDVNRTACVLLAIARDELVGHKLSRVVLSEDQDVLYRHRRELARDVASTSCELRMRRRDGSVIWMQLSTSVGEDRTGARVLRGVLSDITQRREAQAELARSVALTRATLDSMASQVAVIDARGFIVAVNRPWVTEAERHERAEDDHVRVGVGANLLEACEPSAMVVESEERLKQMREIRDGVAAVLAGRLSHFATEYVCRSTDGDTWFRVSATPLEIVERGAVVAYTDITGDKRAEAERALFDERLQQVAKMQSIGRLAGGVAHDFNNMLAAILTSAELALQQVAPDHPAHDELVAIQEAAQRSADLTRQLLAFARQQAIVPRAVDLNACVEPMIRMLGRLVGERVRLRWHPEPNLWTVLVDPAQVDQILANLCTNARDAMPNGGTIALSSANCVIDADYCAVHHEATPGEFVRLTVEDDGCGMGQEVLAHIFEPFFTTKELGAGTGLGLATVHGAVIQNGGFVTVSSEPSRGTRFEIHLPRTSRKAVEPERVVQTGPVGGHERILLVEDEPAILKITARILEKQGYTVLRASTAAEAIRLAETEHEPIHLLVTDVVMPNTSGRELATELLARRPGLKCLFVSGYTADVIARHGVLDAGLEFLQKPFTIHDLAAKVRAVLDTAPTSSTR